MTITQPNRNRQLGLIMTGLIFASIVGVLVAVFMYNQTVNARHLVSDLTEQAEQLRVVNAELKNRYYAIVDPKQQIIAAQKLGLVKESGPTYMTVGMRPVAQPASIAQN